MVGGFYTGGSNVKHNFPIAFSMTMLSWALLEYESVFKASGLDRELTELIQWGVTYLLQTKFQNIIFPQVRPRPPFLAPGRAVKMPLPVLPGG